MSNAHRICRVSKFAPKLFFLFLFSLGSAVIFSNSAKNLPDNPNFRTADFLKPIKYLASDKLNGRGDGTPDLDLAADFIAHRFRKSKLQPLGDNGTYMQHFRITVSAELGKNNSLEVDRGNKQERFTLEKDFRPFIFSSSRLIKAGLVFAGYGITASELDYDDYKGLGVQDKIVIVLDHEPQEHDEKSKFAGKELTGYSRIVNKVINAKNHGAIGLILVSDIGNHPNEPDEFLPFGRPAGPRDAGIIAVQVKFNLVNDWIKTGGKDLESLRKAIDRDLSNHSFALDSAILVSLQTDLNRIERSVANVVGILSAQNSSKDEYVVIGAHYDHLGRGDQNSLAPKQIGQIHPGADDNASGVSGLILLANELSKQRNRLKRSIIFTAFAGEELGLLGSDYYAAHAPIPLEKTVAMVNMDMIGRLTKNRVYIGGTGTSPGFPKLLEKANENVGFELVFSTSGYGASDHTSFAKHNIPVLFFFSGLHSDYHKPTDTWDKINSSQATRVLSLVYRVVREMDAVSERPPYVRATEPASAAAGGGGGGYGPYFGSIPDFGEIEHGVRFADVRDNSPAAKAGLKAGDILIEFGGKKIDNLYDFTYALRTYKPGDEVPVVVMRGPEKVTTKATLERRK